MKQKSEKQSSLPLDWELVFSQQLGLSQGNVANRGQANYPFIVEEPLNLVSKIFWWLEVKTFHWGPLRLKLRIEYNLKEKGKDLLKLVDETTGMRLHFIRQTHPRGLGDAVLRPRLSLKWTLIVSLVMVWWISQTKRLFHLPNNSWMTTSVPTRLYRCYASPSRRSICLGCCSARRRERRSLQRWNLVEKPAPEDAPSDLAIIGATSSRLKFSKSSKTKLQVQEMKFSWQMQSTPSIKHNVYLLVSSKGSLRCRRQVWLYETSIDYALKHSTSQKNDLKTISSNSEKGVSWGRIEEFI